MATFQINWIDKPGGSQNPRTRIERVGGDNPVWSDSANNVIQAINNREHKLYVAQGNSTSWVEVGYRNGIPYLRTESDQTPIDNLLSLRNVSLIR